MTAMPLAATTPGLFGRAVQHVERMLGTLDAVPWSLIALPMRAAAFTVFFRSGLIKLDDWDAALFLFQEEYRVPVLAPEVAAYLAVAVELGASTLLLVGLATRPAAAALLGMALVIQTLVYPQAWPDHIQWLAFLLPLLLRGPGSFSLDAVVRTSVLGREH